MLDLSTDLSTVDDNLELSTVTSRFSDVLVVLGPGETPRGEAVGVARILGSPDKVLGTGDAGFSVGNTED